MDVYIGCTKLVGLLTFTLLCAAAARSQALSSAFTYQGQIQQAGIPVNGTCDLQFSLFWDSAGSTQYGSTQTLAGVSITNGLFTVQLNGANQFGAGAFSNGDRWLQIAVRCPSGSGSYVALSPLQQITPAPYAASSGANSDITELDALTGPVGLGAGVGGFGQGAMHYNYGFGNCAVGQDALYEDSPNQYDSFSTAVGTRALYKNNGENNTAVGYEALYGSPPGGCNSAVGANALRSLSGTGQGNTAVGCSALFSTTQGYGNCAFGSLAMDSNTIGGNNVAIGNQALTSLTSGNNNVALGAYAGNAFTGNESRNIVIGTSGVTGDSDTIRIGGGPLTQATFIAGIYGNSSSSGVPVIVNSSGKLGTTVSSARFKKDVHEMGDSTSGLFNLRPVRFRYRADVDPSGMEQYGLIAEEVAAVYPELVANDADGRPYTVRYQFLAPMLLNEVQKQAQRLNEQSRQLEEQARQISRLQEQVGEIAALKSAIVSLQARVGISEAASAQPVSGDRAARCDTTPAAF